MKDADIIKSPDILGKERILPNQRETDDFPVLPGKAPNGR